MTTRTFPDKWLVEFEQVKTGKKDLFDAAASVGMTFKQARHQYVKASFFQAYNDWLQCQK